MYYKHSGRFTVGGLAMAIVAGATGSLPLAYGYARGLILITDEHVSLLATIAFGCLIGVATGYGLVWGKVRNQAVALAVLGTTSALGLYVSWAMWVASILEAQHAEASWSALAQHPIALWNVVRLINQYGTWGLDSGSPVNGGELWGFWLAEAVAVTGLALSIGHAIWNHHPFCESCGSWCRRGARTLLTAPPSTAQLGRQLESNDLQALGSLGSGDGAGDHLAVVLDTCPHCRAFHTMSLTHVTVRRSKLGKSTVRKSKILQHLMLGQGQVETLRQISEKTTQAAKLNPTAIAAAAGKK